MNDFARLSERPVWPLQRAYFEAQGPRAWASGAVPHYVTSHPYLARAFAEVIAGFAADRARARPSSEPRPLYIVELGAGSGRLGYQIVRALRAALDLAAAGWRPIYVMTDLAERTVAWWQAHPWLRPLVDAGLLDFARFDVESDDRLTLRASGRVISTSAPADELVVIANYVLDSLPQDVFASDGTTLDECLAATPQLVASVAGSGFAAIEMTYALRPAAPDYYGDPLLDGILEQHRRDARGVFTFPCAAIAGLERLRAMASGRMLLLSADKGGARLDEVGGDTGPGLSVHGSVSMTVNYHAIGAWALARGGTWMHTAHRRGTLEICAFAVGASDPRATAAAFSRAIAQRGPDDFYTIKKVVTRRADELALAELLAYLRLAGHDAKLFLDLAPAIGAAVAGADADDREDLALAMERVWDGYLPIGESTDLATVLGALATAIGRPDDVRWRRARDEERALAR
jgi:hypothetical protein